MPSFPQAGALNAANQQAVRAGRDTGAAPVQPDSSRAAISQVDRIVRSGVSYCPVANIE
jgi:hypothetical protein